MTGTSWPDEGGAHEAPVFGRGGTRDGDPMPPSGSPEATVVSSGPTGKRLTVLSGPSGVGKSTVVAELRRSHPEVWLSVSVTTRTPRPGETHGVEYFFVSAAEFDRLVAGGDLLEWAEFAGNRYGTPRGPVQERLAAGVPTLLEIDLQGARQVRRSMPEALLVFLAPPSWQELEKRLRGRGTEPEEVIERRLAAGRVELAAEKEFDLTLVNTAIGEVCERLIAVMN
ncbi:guanylate kinase [Sphaerisporangium rufum]|uniref:Guanylate kinase n=2 Tax=Sphaerisporangium rufum TaxID=1381558 RepID=A0A919UWL5_9ACTN|nr:guanylate kinase [Sphaerisporangium rufum]